MTLYDDETLADVRQLAEWCADDDNPYSVAPEWVREVAHRILDALEAEEH